MSRNFQKMTKEELSKIVLSDELADMDTNELNQLRKAVKAAGLLNEQFGNIIGLASNNRTYEEIKNSKNYTDEEKALALDARNEYNSKIRSQLRNKYYNAEEILSKAHFDGKVYHFTTITKGEMDFLLDTGAVRFDELHVDKDYKVGQVKESNLQSIVNEIRKNPEKAQAIANLLPALAANAQKREENAKKQAKKQVSSQPALPTDLQKSYDFWNKFNEKSEQTGVKFIITNIENKSLMVEAQKNGKTMFKGIDHGAKGFDVVKRDKSAEPYEIYDLLIKKVKTGNPKAKIRIKDNVKDEVLRNKILIACAKNNMVPVGNLPEGFDFDELKALVKDAKTTEDINDLAYNLYRQEASEFSIGGQEEEKDERMFGAGSVNKKEEENKAGNTAVGAPVIVNNGSKTSSNKDKPSAPIIVNKDNGNGNNGGNGGNGGNIPPANKSNKKPVKEPWYKRVWNKTKKWFLGAAIVAVSFFGVRSCQNQQKMQDDVDDIKNKIENFQDCKCQDRYNAGYADGYKDGKEDCENSKPKPVVRKKQPVKKKTTPVKKTPVVVNDTIRNTVTINDTIRNTVTVNDTIKKQVVVEEPVAPSAIPLQEVDTGVRHEKDYDLNEAKSLSKDGKTIDWNTAVAMYNASKQKNS